MAKKKEESGSMNLNFNNSDNNTVGSNNISNNSSNSHNTTHNYYGAKTSKTQKGSKNGAGWFFQAIVGGVIALAVAILAYYFTTGSEKGKAQVFESNSPGILSEEKR